MQSSFFRVRAQVRSINPGSMFPDELRIHSVVLAAICLNGPSSFSFCEGRLRLLSIAVILLLGSLSAWKCVVAAARTHGSQSAPTYSCEPTSVPKGKPMDTHH